MERTLDLSRWSELPHGVNYRRWVIISMGVRHIVRTRFFRILLTVAWLAGLAIAAAGFLFSQSVSTGGLLETMAHRMGPRMEATVAMLGGFVTLFPDVIVGGIFSVIFWIHSYVGLALSLIALTILVPSLITTDRASNALTMYLSRPLTSTDYLLGKLGIIACVLALVWTGPLLLGWLLSMAFAPDRDFIIYSFSPLLRALAFNGIAFVALSCIALGVSALGRSSTAAAMVWIVLTLLLAFPTWVGAESTLLRRISFYQDLTMVRLELFDLSTIASEAAVKLPLLSAETTQSLTAASRKAESNDFTGALVSLGAFCVASTAVFLRRIRAE